MFTKMFTKLKERIRHFDYKIKKIMKSGFYVSFYILDRGESDCFLKKKKSCSFEQLLT